MTAFLLKLIAILSMLWDHARQGLELRELLVSAGAGAGALALLDLLAPLGRLAFPIFAFLIGEGCKHTKNEGRYLCRLLLFSLFSEVPFDLVFYKSVSFAQQNVFFTLFLGALSCLLWDRLREWDQPGWQALGVGAACLAALLAELLHSDYRALGVLLIFLPYVAEKRSRQLLSIGLLLTVLYLGRSCWTDQGFAWLRPDLYSLPKILLRWGASLLALLPIGLYNGRQGPRAKWSFYLFYPLHLLAILGARALLES